MFVLPPPKYGRGSPTTVLVLVEYRTGKSGKTGFDGLNFYGARPRKEVLVIESDNRGPEKHMADDSCLIVHPNKIKSTFQASWLGRASAADCDRPSWRCFGGGRSGEGLWSRSASVGTGYTRVPGHRSAPWMAEALHLPVRYHTRTLLSPLGAAHCVDEWLVAVHHQLHLLASI